MKNLKLQTLGIAFIAVLFVVGTLSLMGALITVSNVSSVKSTWNTFEAGRSEKASALSALRKETGYGGMIHQFKNYILRHDGERIGLINQKLGGALSAVANYRALGTNDAETTALDNIVTMLRDYGAALSTASEGVRDGKTPVEIDRVARVDDGPAIQGLDVLDAEVTRIYESQSAAQSKPQAIASLRKAMGYGGMIHHFKNFVLRQDAQNQSAVTRDIADAREALALYAKRNLTRAEILAIRDTGQVIDAYQAALEEAVVLAKNGRLPIDIDRAVKVDDGPAFTGFDTLTREVSLESAGEARKVDRALNFVSSLAEGTAWVTVSITFIMISVAIWMFRFQIIRPIGRMTNLMTRLASGDLELQVHAAEQTNEIGEMARAVEVFKENAIERLRVEKVKGEFVSTVSHELRTPLTSIKGSLGLVRSGSIGEMPDKIKSMVDIAYNNSDRLVRLINDILDVDKISAGKMEFRMAPLDLVGLVDQALAENKAYGEEHNATFRVESTAAKAMVNGDHDRLMQVLANLLSNAAKYSPDGGEVEIALYRRAESYRISVTDTGAGVPEEFRDQVFERFSQADSSDTRQSGGTGLGLNITKAIVEHHGGAIGFKSEVGKGSTFSVDLPALREKSADKEIPSGGVAGVADAKKPRILHVEDDPDVVEVVLAIVGKRAVVFSARTFEEARRLLAREAYDLIILDLMLPDRDGEDLIPLINEAGSDAPPIIVFSAKDINAEVGSQVLAVYVKSRTSNEALADSILSAIEPRPVI